MNTCAARQNRPQRSCLGNKTEAARDRMAYSENGKPQRSCLGNKTEATIAMLLDGEDLEPQRSCLGNKTEALVDVVDVAGCRLASTKLPR